VFTFQRLSCGTNTAFYTRHILWHIHILWHFLLWNFLVAECQLQTAKLLKLVYFEWRIKKWTQCRANAPCIVQRGLLQYANYVDTGPIVLRAFCHGWISGSQSVAQPGFFASTAETTKCAHKNNRGRGALQYFYAPANITLALEGSVM